MNLRTSESALDQNVHAAMQTFGQTRTGNYIILSALTSVTWDWILSLSEEYWMLESCGLSVSVIAYFLARTSAITLCILVTLVQMGSPVFASGNCATIFAINGALGVIGTAAKSYLFLLRVCAVHGNSKLVALLFGVGWLGVVGTRSVIPFKAQSYRVETTSYCFVKARSWTLLAMWVNLAYNTCVFAAISARLASHAAPASKWPFLSLLRGHGLPRTMRHLLRNGYLFYLTTVAFSLLVSMMGTLHVPQMFKGIFAPPALMAEIIVACKVFRAAVLESARLHHDRTTRLGAVCTTVIPLSEHDFALELDTVASGSEQRPV